MQLTKLRAAPVRQAEVPPCAPAGRTDGGTASPLIRSVPADVGGATDDAVDYGGCSAMYFLVSSSALAQEIGKIDYPELDLRRADLVAIAEMPERFRHRRAIRPSGPEFWVAGKRVGGLRFGLQPS